MKPKLSNLSVYDAQGRRTEKRVLNAAGVRTLRERYIYVGYTCVQVLNGDNGNAVVKEFAWDPTEPMATRPLTFRYAPNGTMHFYCFDGNKNVSDLFFLAVQNGVSAHYEYAPFGAVTRTSKNTPFTLDFVSLNPWRFSSEFYDPELDLICYNYRHYSPSLGRWLSRDPIEEQGGLNLYVFVRNIPTQFSDILGQSLFGLDFDYTSSLQVGGCLPIPAAPGVSICLTGGYTVTVGECCQGCAKKQMVEMSGDINISVSFGVPSLLSLSYTHGVVIESDNPPNCPASTGGIKGSAFVGFNIGFANGQCTYDMSKDSWSCSTSLQFNPQFNVYGGGAINFYKITIE